MHFYDTDATLADRVTDFIGSGIRAGGTALLIATEAHLRLFVARLDEAGCHTTEERASGRLILCDADELLEKLTSAAPPDDPRFRQTIGALVEPMLAGLDGQRLRIYGEMVDLLWRAGHHQAALWLEEVWNDLAKAHRFELLCTYALVGLAAGSSSDFIDICDRHTHVVPDAPAPAAAPDHRDHPTRLLVAEITHRREVERVLRDCARHLRQAEGRERERSHRNLQLQTATARLAAALTQEDVCAALLSIAEDVLQASAGIVYLRGSDGELEMSASRGLIAPERFRRLPRNVPMPLTTAVEQRRAILLSTRRELIQQYPHLEVTETPASDLQAVAALPLIHGSTLLGGFAVSFANERPFDEDERLWLDSIAVQAALAADRARLYEAERRAREEAETLYRIGESLNATQLDLETVVQRVTDEATKLTGAEFGAFFHNVPGETGESFQLYTLSGAPKETFAKLGLPRKTPLFAPTFAGQGVVRVNDVRVDARYGQLARRDGTPGGMPEGHLPVSSYLAVPVTSRSGVVLGALLFGHSRPGRFTAEHERLTKSLAAAAALAVDNANLYGETRRAEADQRQLNDELRETVHVNELFVAVLAHDLRSPLAAMLTAADLIQSREAAGVESRHEKALLRLTASGQRMTRMIEQLLDFTRLRIGGGLTLEPRVGELGPLVHQVADELEGSGTGHGIEIAQIGDGNGRWDTDRLGQVFSNLFANALQHGGPQGEVQAPGKVHVQIDGSLPNTVRVRVHNTGAISAELIPRIFDPMIAGDRRRDGSRGLGLGLFITQRIVEAHGGSVDVVSAENTGTTFTVTLPRFAKAASVGISAGTDGKSSPRARKETPAPGTDPWPESDTRFRMLVDAIKDYAIFMLDPRGHVVTWNEGAKRIKGYEASEIIGQHFSRFYEEPQASDGTCDRELEIATRDKRFEDEGWRVRKDGSKFWANVVITPLRDKNDQLVGFTKVTRDLTERRRLQDEQLRAAKAEEAIRVRDEFLSLVSHELKTPLTILQMQLDTLPAALGDPSDRKVATKLGRAADSSGRLARLIDSLMDVASMATGRFVLNLQRYDLGESMRHLIDYLAPAAARANCELSLHTEGDLVGKWDHLRVEQAVIHMVSNALRFGFGKPIQLELRRKGDEVCLDVRDHGPGIPEGDLERIFVRFERPSSSVNSGGLGLGLYFIHEIAAAHGGSISVENIPGDGACFQLRLPVRPPVLDVGGQSTKPKGN